MPQNWAESTAFLSGAGEREINRTTRRVKEKRLQQKYSHGLLWLPYRKLNSEAIGNKLEEMLIGVQILPISKGGLSHRHFVSSGQNQHSKKRGRRQENESSLLLLEEAMMQMMRHSLSYRLLFVQDEFHPPDHHFMMRLEEILGRTSFPAWRLDFSFPQSIFSKGSENYWLNLAALRDGGARIFMRDFFSPPSSMAILEDAYKASILDGVQCRMMHFLSEDEHGNIWEEKEMLFRQHLLKAVRSLGLIIQINDVSLAHEEEAMAFFAGVQKLEIDEGALIQNHEINAMNSHCEIIAPFSEALASLDDETYKAALRSRHVHTGIKGHEMA